VAKIAPNKDLQNLASKIAPTKDLREVRTNKALIQMLLAFSLQPKAARVRGVKTPIF
jgi:hypothetical protein